MNIYDKDDLLDYKVGLLIRSCQRIEHDVKVMYAGMLKGNYRRNLNKVINLTLGTVINKLKELDNSDDKPYLGLDDYKYLNEITDTRNYWVHKAYIELLYVTQQEYNNKLNELYSKISNDCEIFGKLADQVENVRIEMMNYYGRS